MTKERTDQLRLSRTQPETCYYVYVHRRLTDGQPFYVGKGKNGRAWAFSGRSQYWENIVKKHGYSVDLVFSELTESDAFQCEVDTILEFKYFGYPLCNMTNGGEGLSGFKWTPDQMKNHPCRKNIGRIQSPEEIENRRRSMMGHEVSLETRNKIRDAQLGKSVISQIVKYLRGRRIISVVTRAKILGVDPRTLCKKPEHYAGFTKEQVQKSADARRGKPAWNSGGKCPQTSGSLNGSADCTSYTFRRLSDGLIFIGDRYTLANTFNLNLSILGKLFYTKPNKSSQGWELLKENNGTT